ncbi:MAG: polymer-forming cytoskeletal protein [Thermoanaerobaculia bacterium]
MSLRSRSTSGELNGFLDAGSHLTGELQFEQTFRVDGKVTGKVISEGDLVVGEKGEIDGEVRVGRLYVCGLVRGKVFATRRLEVSAGGRLLGDLEASTVILEEGSIFQGSCTMPQAAATPTVEKSESGAKVVGRIPASKA